MNSWMVRAVISWRRLIDVVMLVLLLAGLAKLSDLTAFAGAMQTWEFIPPNIRMPIVITLPATELAIALAWFLRIWPSTAVAAGAAILMVFTAVYGVHLQSGRAPDCGCFGRYAVWQTGMQEARWVVGRNFLLLGLLGAGTWFGRRNDAGYGAVNSVRHEGITRSRGFTLIEMLVLLAILAIVVGIILPTLASSRRSAQAAGAIGAMRQHAAVLSAYAGDWRDSYPYFTDPQRKYTEVMCGDQVVHAEYFWAEHLWACSLAQSGYYATPNDKSLYPPGYQYRAGTPIRYSSNFLAHWGYWNWATRTGPRQWQSVKSADVVHPSRKGLLVSWANAQTGPATFDFRDSRLGLEVAFCDGSARLVRQSDLRRPVPDGVGPWAGTGINHGSAVLHTVDGSRGVDVD